MLLLSILYSLFLPAAGNLPAGDGAAPEEFLKGTDCYSTYSPSREGNEGKTLVFGNRKALILWHESGVVVAVEEAGGSRRNVLFMNGKLTMPSRTGYSYPKIGYSTSGESRDNEYLLGAHDFTGDGDAELVLAVRSKDAIGIFILQETASGWKPLGEIVTKGKGLGGARIFRQAVTLKNAATGVLYTWTWHGESFDFLASDHADDPRKLF